MITDDSLNIDEMRKICYEIVDEELKSENIKLNIFPLTFVEVYSFYIPYRKYSLVKSIGYATLPLMAYGYNNLEGDVLIFLNSENMFFPMERKIFNLVELCYHEIRHGIQEKFDIYSYEGFSRGIEKYFIKSIDYYLRGNKYSFEIGADLYSVRKAREYLEKKYPAYVEKNYTQIEKLEKKSTFNYMMYDINESVDRIISALRDKNNIKDNKLVDKVNALSRDKFFKNKFLSEVSPVLEIFLNEDASFKSIKEIINNDKFKMLDKKIIFVFLSCKLFLEELEFNIETLTEDELSLVNDALEYKKNIYSNQNKFLDESLNKKDITLLNFLKNQKSLMNKITFLEEYQQIVIERLGNCKEIEKTIWGDEDKSSKRVK